MGMYFCSDIEVLKYELNLKDGIPTDLWILLFKIRMRMYRSLYKMKMRN